MLARQLIPGLLFHARVLRIPNPTQLAVITIDVEGWSANASQELGDRHGQRLCHRAQRRDRKVRSPVLDILHVSGVEVRFRGERLLSEPGLLPEGRDLLAQRDERLVQTRVVGAGARAPSPLPGAADSGHRGIVEVFRAWRPRD